MPDYTSAPLTAAAVEALLDGSIPRRVLVFPSLPSTNTTLHALAAEGAPDGTAVLARAQSAGRGRRGRSFCSPADAGLYMSVLLRRPLPTGILPLLTPYAAVCAVRAIRTVCPLSPDIKWVNDLRIGGKKVCGILTEGEFAAGGDSLSYAVVGIGINLTPTPLPPDVAGKAACLADFAPPPAPAALAAALLNRIFGDLSSLTDRSFLSEYRLRSEVLHRRVGAIVGGRTVTGLAVGIGEDGSLLLETDEGPLALQAGEVSLIL